MRSVLDGRGWLRRISTAVANPSVDGAGMIGLALAKGRRIALIS